MCTCMASSSTWVLGSHKPCSWLWSCESVDLACFTSDCDAQLLYTDAAPVLYASSRVAVTAQSGILDVHVHDVVEPRTRQAKETVAVGTHCSSSRGRVWMPCGVQARARGSKPIKLNYTTCHTT